MSIVPIIIAIEEQYKNYLFVCKYLRIDPSVQYEQEIIDNKVDCALVDENIEKKFAKKLSSFKKNYKKMEGGVLGNRFISRAKKEISKGKLVLDVDISS